MRKTASTFGVLVATLCRIKKAPERIRCRNGSLTILTSNEEKDVIDCALEQAQKGLPVTKDQLLDNVQLFMKKLKNKGRKNPFTNDRAGRHWFEGFQTRYPSLSIKTA